MDIVIYLGGALVFFALVMASIALHEVGHLVPGKLFDVKTTQYFVGFGKTLWSRRLGETEYGVKAVPLGGYVRFVGMYPPAKDRPGQVRAARHRVFQPMADNARAAEWEDIRPDDDGRLFYQKKSVAEAGHHGRRPDHEHPAGLRHPARGRRDLRGLPVPAADRPGPGVHRRRRRSRQQLRRQAEDPGRTVRASAPGTGGRLQRPAGRYWDECSTPIRANLDRPGHVTVGATGQRLDLTTVNTVITGVPDRWDPSKRVAAGFFGVEPWSSGSAAAGRRARRHVEDDPADRPTPWPIPGQGLYTAYNLVTGEPRDMYGPMSIVGASRAAGEIASTDQIGAAGEGGHLFAVLGSVNLFVALFNFVPLLPLDGGHIAGALYEGAARAAARLFRRPDPGLLRHAPMLPLAYAVGGLILVSGVVLILADIIDPIRLSGSTPTDNRDHPRGRPERRN